LRHGEGEKGRKGEKEKRCVLDVAVVDITVAFAEGGLLCFMNCLRLQPEVEISWIGL